jgi:YD repeat-containing protein
LTKTDAINNQSIEYTYDHLMRLTSWTVNDNDTHSITYDATTGNIISKSDLGASSEFIYDSSSKPHALRGIDNITGEWICPDLSITYTDFSKVKSIQRGSDSYNIMYGVDKQRACTQKTISGATTTRYYMSNHEIVVDSLGNETYIIYLCNGSIAVHDKASGAKTLYHGYYDAQGSLIALTDDSGHVLARYAYDP